MGWLCVRQAIIGKWGNVREKAPSTSSDLVGVLSIRRPRSFSYLVLFDARYDVLEKHHYFVRPRRSIIHASSSVFLVSGTF